MSLSFASPVHIAWVTRGLDATEKALTGLLGAKRWVRLPAVHFAPDRCSYHGAPAGFVADISLSYLGDMQPELIEPVRGPNIYSDFLGSCGPRLHHICAEVDTLENFAALLASATGQGAAVPLQGAVPGGLRFGYLSAPQHGIPFGEIPTSRPRCVSSSTTSSRSSVE